ncbi:myb-like dna-binding shaqkyf class family protein [Stylonychia lemnae]|uniref:Myb-like dna-binding shaqkyf class family protein n=1 Tax=Stylonychia lemnae TaxID=5949 RepID=A0A078ATS7_STYLE|nr:myb-like dna-binding shaqkyf class family protein [Stylonychia lemnae]|eukprot:CDW85830.1 myb-like dna-binding shaqkyf class family protein [Stylonychia lemnae]
MSSERWSDEDHNRFVKALKTIGKNWKQIAIDVGTKNEQQCRTRGLIIFNRLQRHCWDEELKKILTPHQGYMPRDAIELKKREEKRLLKQQKKDQILEKKTQLQTKNSKLKTILASKKVDQGTTTDIIMNTQKIPITPCKPFRIDTSKPFMIINEKHHLYQKELKKINEEKEEEDPESDIIKVKRFKKIGKFEEDLILEQSIKVEDLIRVKDQDHSIIQSSQETCLLKYSQNSNNNNSRHLNNLKSLYQQALRKARKKYLQPSLR